MIEQAQLDFDAIAPAPAPQDAPGRGAGRGVGGWVSPADAGAPVGGAIIAPAGRGTFTVGQYVYLRGARFGQPGRVLRIERGKVCVLWPDLGPSYIGRHSPESLVQSEDEVEYP